jgi:hypothetical protein
MLEGTTNGILSFKEPCFYGLCAREELMCSDEGLQCNQSRRTSSDDGNTHTVLCHGVKVGLGLFDLVKGKAGNKQTSDN